MSNRNFEPPAAAAAYDNPKIFCSSKHGIYTAVVACVALSGFTLAMILL
jgi:hypothetical protein